MEDLLKSAVGEPSPRRSRHWVLDAACADTKDPDLFFAEGPVPAEVLALCHACPVRLACLCHALVAGELHGIWGGLTADERANLVVRRPDEAQLA